jgi:hypothetical protein
MKALKVTPDNETSVIDIDLSGSLRPAAKLLGTDTVELVYPRRNSQYIHLVMLVDEDGLMKHLKTNLLGCILYFYGEIVGDILIMGHSNGDILGIPEAIIAPLQEVVASLKSLVGETEPPLEDEDQELNS